MKSRFILQWFILICIFIVALVMEIAPWPAGFQSFKPAWLVLTLMYWVLSIPNRIGIGCAFILGVMWDLVLGSTLGIHALVLSIFTYLMASNHLLFRNLSLWLQSLLMMVVVAAIRLSIFVVELFVHTAQFQLQEIVGAIISGILWPWVFLLLRKIRQQLDLK